MNLRGRELEFYSDKSQFVVTFPNMNYGVMGEQVREQVREQVEEQVIGTKTISQLIEYCKNQKSRVELQEYCGLLGRRNFNKKYLSPLIESGIMKMTVPDKPTSSKQKYYSV